MARFNFILNQFGLQAAKIQAFNIPEPLDTTNTAGEITPQQIETITPEGYSYLGTPVWSRVTLRSPEDENIFLDLDSVLLEVTQTKNIVTTMINGRNGTVKEYVSDGDYLVTIRGALFSQNNGIPPVEDFQRLIDLCKIPQAIIVESTFLQYFGIYNIVIQDQSFPQSEGILNAQPFELTCLSDEPLELLL